MKKGKFISIEGTDGSGKSTQLEKIKNFLNEKGIDAIYVREPGSTPIGEKIREIILDAANTEMSPRTEMFLYSAARAQLIDEVIKPELATNKIVICDRFVDSSYAYQGFGRELGLDNVVAANELALNGLMPDLTLFFDISPSDALARRLNVSQADRLESESEKFFETIYSGYSELADLYSNRIKRIDATQSIEQIALNVEAILNEFLDLK